MYDGRVKKHAISIVAFTLVMGLLARHASAQPTEPVAPADPSEPSAPALPPSTDPLAEPPSAPPQPAPTPQVPPQTEPRYESRPVQEPREEREEMSEGRRIVVAWNTGFQWGLSPGVVFADGKTSFFLGLRLGYGFDTGKVIIVPGVRLSGYFTDPNVYLGMPVVKLVYPIDRFAPFIEGGAGVGHVEGRTFAARNSSVTVDPKTGLAVLVGAGFMIHFTQKFGLGVEGTYQTVTGTNFSGFGIGPILALAF